MVTVGLTYSQPLVSDAVAGRSAGGVQRTASDSTGPKTDDTRPGYISSGNTPEQKGLQPSEPAVDEFRPYTRFSSQKNFETGDAKKPQGDITSAGGGERLDPQVQAAIDRLKANEEKVKAHEAAHKSAGGTMTGPVSYSYSRGPDGRNYITGGEVPISVSPGKTPQETISRMQQVIQAALAPADPSPQDRAVAAQAAAQQQEASQKLAAAQSMPEAPPTVSLEPQNRADSTAPRDSQRAYGNPAVTGTQPGTAVVAEPLPYDPPGAASPPADSIRSSLPPVTTPAGITGFGVSRPVSYFA